MVVPEITAATMTSLEDSVVVVRSDHTPDPDLDQDLGVETKVFRGAGPGVAVLVTVYLVSVHIHLMVATCVGRKAPSSVPLIVETKLLPAPVIATDRSRLQSDGN